MMKDLVVPLGHFKVTYMDGVSEVAKSNFGGIIEVERKFGTDADGYATVLAFGVWCYLGHPGDDFESWAGGVHWIEPTEEPGAKPAMVPSEPVAGAA